MTTTKARAPWTTGWAADLADENQSRHTVSNVASTERQVRVRRHGQRNNAWKGTGSDELTVKSKRKDMEEKRDIKCGNEKER